MIRHIKTAVITGPTGAIGTALCRLLCESGVIVYAVVRPESARLGQLFQHENLKIVFCDISELNKLPDLMGGITADAFFHFAWAKTTGTGRNDMPAQIDNIQYTIDAVRAAKDLDCQVFIGAGSQAEYGRVEGSLTPNTPCFPENGYGMAKLCAGQMSRVEAQKLGIAHIWPRILSVYGPNDGKTSMISSVIIKLMDRAIPSLTAGEQQWDYLYCSDAARAMYQMAMKGLNGAVYPLGSGQARPLKEYIFSMRDAIDPMLKLGLGDIPYGDKQVMYLKADISDLSRDTGWQPETDFDTGIAKTIVWMKEELK